MITQRDEGIISSLRHIALMVPNLRMAEDYYMRVFDMEIIGREAMRNDGLWYTLPFDKTWDDAVAGGIDLDMVALRSGTFVLALFRGNPVYGQIYALGLVMPAQEIARIRARLGEDAQITEEGPTHLSFIDPYQITWQISVPGNEFRTSGVFAGRWLKL